MAENLELFGLWNESELRNRVTVAVVKATKTIWEEDAVTPNHANRLLWAKATLMHPRPMANAMFRYVLAVNHAATVVVILNATDIAIQNAVDSAVDMFATGE